MTEINGEIVREQDIAPPRSHRIELKHCPPVSSRDEATVSVRRESEDRRTFVRPRPFPLPNALVARTRVAVRLASYAKHEDASEALTSSQWFATSRARAWKDALQSSQLRCADTGPTTGGIAATVRSALPSHVSLAHRSVHEL